MAKAVKTEADKNQAPIPADITIDGIHFNQDWAKKVTEDAFVTEFKDAHYQDLTEEARIAALKAAYQRLVAA